MKRIAIFYFLFFIIFAVTACSTDDFVISEPNTPVNKKEFTVVKSVLEYYRANSDKFAAIKIRNIQSDSIKWGLSRVVFDEKGNATLSIPIATDLTQEARYILAIKANRNNSISGVYFAECKPLSDFYTKSKDLLYYNCFSGTAYIYDTNNKFIETQQYNDGLLLTSRGFDDVNELPEVVVTAMRIDWNEWLWEASSSGSGHHDVVCPLCGSRDIIYNNITEKMYCNCCGYGLDDGGGGNKNDIIKSAKAEWNDIKTLVASINNILNKNDIGKNLLAKLITNKISFTFVALNNEKYTIGKYIGKEKTIEINKASDIYINGDEKEMSLTLLHEYMHAFQHQTMGNDFADYSFTLNAEFEAYYFEYLYVVSGNMIDDFKKYETSELYDAINAYETNQTEENYQVALKALKDLGYTCNGNSKYNNYTTNVDKIFKNK